MMGVGCDRLTGIESETSPHDGSGYDMQAIFISYRRDDAEGQAGRLFVDLTKQFGEDAVFMDVAAIQPGRDFRRAIEEHVTSCGVLLALIGKNWLTATNDSGTRRLDDPTDFVRLETASALKRDIPVVPVLVHGASMPRAQDLPDDLKELSFRNGVELTHARWESDVQVLAKALQPYVQRNAEPTALPAAIGADLVRPKPRRLWAVLAGLVVLGFGGYAAYQKFAAPAGAIGLASPMSPGNSEGAEMAAVVGAIREKWLKLGGGGSFGYATDIERPTFDGVGRAQQFSGGGSISWHPAIGAFAVWGAIGAKWGEIGRENYGYPITDELTADDGRGRLNHFRSMHLPDHPEASIYWSPTTGAHEVRGAIRAAWFARGAERGTLGYPTSDEHSTPLGERRSNFVNGYITWTAQGGARVNGESLPP
jgi:hypothetical protein